MFAPYLPEPPMSGGRIRMHHFVKAVAGAHELHLFAVAPKKQLKLPAVQEGLSRFSSATVVPPQLAFLPMIRLPRRVRNASAPALRAAFNQEHARAPFDAVWVEHVQAAQLASQAGLPWLLDEHNVESDYLRDWLKARGSVSALQRRELAGLIAWERARWAEAEQVVCVTQADADAVAAVRGRPPELVPNGVDLSQLSYTPPSARGGAEVLFVGLMDHPPNERAAEFLAREVMPALWAERPEAKLTLCGANPSRGVLGLAGPRVEVTGTVPSVAPYLARASAYAFALFHGAGSSLKLLEAMAVGLPLVASPVAVRGFSVQPGEHYLPAEDAAGFITQLKRALGEDPEADARAARARAVAEQHDWARLSARMRALIEGLVP